MKTTEQAIDDIMDEVRLSALCVTILLMITIFMHNQYPIATMHAGITLFTVGLCYASTIYTSIALLTEVP